MTIETTDIFEALNLDSKSRFLKPFERMELHKEICDRWHQRPSKLSIFLIDKVNAMLSEDRIINKRYKRR